MVQVSWFAAQAYCESQGARLPTWDEWEYAAAADETRRDARKRPGLARTHPAWYSRPSNQALPRAGLQAPNAYGVQDLHGLVWEWTEDFSSLLVAGDNRNQGDADNAKFCGAGALSMDDRENYAVLMRVAMLSSLEARRHHRQPGLPLREGRAMNDATLGAAARPASRSLLRRLARRRARHAAPLPRDSVYQLPVPLTDQAGTHRRLAQPARQAAAGGDVLHLLPVHLPADRRQRQGRRARS